MAQHPRTVLVIDDDRDHTDTTALLIGMWGHCPLTAYDASTGLLVARSDKPDVVLVDIALPSTSGLKVGKQLRSDPAFETTVLVAISGYAGPSDRTRAHEHGFDFFISKPYEPETLRRLLRACAGAVQATRLERERARTLSTERQKFSSWRRAIRELPIEKVSNQAKNNEQPDQLNRKKATPTTGEVQRETSCQLC